MKRRHRPNLVPSGYEINVAGEIRRIEPKAPSRRDRHREYVRHAKPHGGQIPTMTGSQSI